VALARALGRSVEELFAPDPTTARPVHPATAAHAGAGLLAARVGATVVYAPAERALSHEGWPRPNAVLRDSHPHLLPGGDFDGLVLVACDPALGLAAALLPAAGPRHVHVISGSTAAALEAMLDGRAHGALVHNRADRLPLPPAGALRLHVARWRVGVAGRRERSVEELCARRVRVVQREEGASTQKAFLAAAAALGAPAPPGPCATGHLEVARRVRDGATAGVTMEPAAHAFGLAFSTLEEHCAELWIDARHREHRAVESLVSTLRSSAFIDRLSLVGAYDTEGCGSQKGAVE
jgi:hypothetical protein